jgi:hypothetical protein
VPRTCVVGVSVRPVGWSCMLVLVAPTLPPVTLPVEPETFPALRCIDSAPDWVRADRSCALLIRCTPL